MREKKHKALFWIANIGLPLLLGCAIYIFLSDDTYVSVAIRNTFRSAAFPRLPILTAKSGLLQLARNHLSDMCWAYALVFCITLCVGSTKKGVILSTFIAGVFSVILEGLQYFHIISGTFDIIDIILEIIACIAAGMIIYKKIRGKAK